MEVGAGTPGNAQAVRDQLAALITGGTYLDVSNLCQSVSYRTPTELILAWAQDACHLNVHYVGVTTTGYLWCVAGCPADAKAETLGCCRWPYSVQDWGHGA